MRACVRATAQSQAYAHRTCMSARRCNLLWMCGVWRMCVCVCAVVCKSVEGQGRGGGDYNKYASSAERLVVSSDAIARVQTAGDNNNKTHPPTRKPFSVRSNSGCRRPPHFDFVASERRRTLELPKVATTTCGRAVGQTDVRRQFHQPAAGWPATRPISAAIECARLACS